jgi:hypothetical protein
MLPKVFLGKVLQRLRFSFGSTGLNDAAIENHACPANYTSILRGANNTTGNALVEVYALN